MLQAERPCMLDRGVFSVYYVFLIGTAVKQTENNVLFPLTPASLLTRCLAC